MKLTDEKILEIAEREAERAGHFFNKYGLLVADEDREIDPQLLLNFARALLKEAGVEELERDAERLDYLDKWAVISKPGQSVREAVDEAIKAK